MDCSIKFSSLFSSLHLVCEMNHSDHCICLWNEEKENSGWYQIWTYLYRCINDYWNCNAEIFPEFATLFNATVKRIFYRCDESDLIQLPVCRNQCCLSGHLSGTGRWCGIVGYFTFETAYYHLPLAGIFSLFVRNGQVGVSDLVGISDYRSNCMPEAMYF